MPVVLPFSFSYRTEEALLQRPLSAPLQPCRGQSYAVPSHGQSCRGCERVHENGRDLHRVRLESSMHIS